MSSRAKLWAEDTGSLHRDTPVLSSPAWMLLAGQGLGIRGDSKTEVLRQLPESPGGAIKHAEFKSLNDPDPSEPHQPTLCLINVTA